MRIILHFGAHKTATTHVQHNLALNKGVLKEKGVKYFKFQENKRLHKAAQRLRRNTQNKGFNLEEVKATIQKEIQNEIKGYECAIASYEGILDPITHQNFTTVYPDAEDVIEVYQEMLSNHEVIPLFASRDYDGFLRSTYKWSLKYSRQGFAISLEDYLSNKKLRPKRWTTVLETMHKAFGHKPKFYAYEEYRENAQSILYEIVALTGKNIAYKELVFDAGEKNVSGNKTSLDFYYTLRVLFSKLPKFKYKNALHDKSKQHFRTWSTTKLGQKLLLKHQKEKIPPVIEFEVYWAEVKELKKKYGLLNPVEKEPK